MWSYLLLCSRTEFQMTICLQKNTILAGVCMISLLNLTRKMIKKILCEWNPQKQSEYRQRARNFVAKDRDVKCIAGFTIRSFPDLIGYFQSISCKNY